MIEFGSREAGDSGKVSILMRDIADLVREIDLPVEEVLVGDTVVLENKDICIRYEETIQFGEPFKEKIIEKEFGQGDLRLTVNPVSVKGLSVWCNDQRMGDVGLKLTLYEGAHNLELRGDALKTPVPFEVRIERGAATRKFIDVSKALAP